MRFKSYVYIYIYIYIYIYRNLRILLFMTSSRYTRSPHNTHNSVPSREISRLILIVVSELVQMIKS